jgi:hypothetical protein
LLEARPPKALDQFSPFESVEVSTVTLIAAARDNAIKPSLEASNGAVAADTDGLEIDELLIAVIALVANDFFDALAVRPYPSTCSAASISVSRLVVVSPSSA